MTTRRECIAIMLAALAQPVAGQPARQARVAILDDATPAVRAPFWAAFRARLASLGWSDGGNLAVDASFANDDRAKLDILAARVVARKPDVLVVATTTVGLAAKKATSDIPVVVMGAADPVRSGLVASLARPGGNLTGVSFNQGEIVGKWLNIVREMVPAAKAVAYMTDRTNPGETLVTQELEQQARSAGMRVEAFDGVTSEGVQRAFAAIAAQRLDALVVGTPSSVLAHRRQIVDAAASSRVPAIYARKEYVEAGGLVSYGADFRPVFEQGADYVDRILKGAKPAELPYIMASSFRLVVNPNAARRINVVIPQSVRIRADEVIE